LNLALNGRNIVEMSEGATLQPTSKPAVRTEQRAAVPFTRPTRGAVRLNQITFDTKLLEAEIQNLNEFWDSRHAVEGYAGGWADLSLMHRGQDGMEEHASLNDCPAIREVIASFPAPVVDVALARLGPGGWIKEHRDFSGNRTMGVARFHIPITTHDEVGFYVSGDRVRMEPGTVWSLDTSYRHRVVNEGDVERVHMIIDVEMTAAIRQMLPAREWPDRAHSAHFALICAGKGLSLAVRSPSQAAERLRNFYRLRVRGQSVAHTFRDS